MVVKIIASSQRARNRIKEHGVKMLLLKEEGDKFLVESLDKTFNKKTEKWMGWFTQEEATFIKETE